MSKYDLKLMMPQSWFPLTLPIAAIFAFRMLGLFMLIPIFSIYGMQLEHATPILIGVALGAYGFSQGMMQMPFGILSDYYGRKPILIVGLILFALGSIWGACTDSIYGMIGARILQGFGAIGSVLIALLADLVKDEDRPKSMAIIGMCIGLSFAIAMIVSPFIANHYGLTGIFQLTVALALCGIVILTFAIPTPIHQKPSSFNKRMLKESFLPHHLFRCHVGIWGQHFILTSSFFAIPLILKKTDVALPSFYLSLMLGAFVIMMPVLAWSERNKKREKLFMTTVWLLIVGQMLLAIIPHQIHVLWIALFIYFVGFNILEALFPSMIAKEALPQLKGTATGIYSTAQFLGIFCGGVASGFIYKAYGVQGIFIINTLLGLAYAVFLMRASKQVVLLNRS